ncbi:MAG: hypothetical protein DPW16_09980 [Chloroflexi bacterium]|nr:hypothetical protein [Chloroflexota bacterium]
MNSLVTRFSDVLHMTHALRSQMFDLLTDADLTYALPNNMTLGALCREMGEVQVAYINSFKTFKLDFSYRHPDKTVETSLAQLKAWFAKLDAELDTTLAALSEADLQKPIDRGGWKPPAEVNFHTYREALLIFYAKADVYLKAMQKPLPEQWQAWMG